jgi:signal transduction histidine kinase
MRTDLAESHLKTTNELKSAESRLQEQQIQLIQSEKMASLGTMAAGVAHEINNPLSFVINNTESLKNYCQVTADLIRRYEEFIDLYTHQKLAEASEKLLEIEKIEKNEDISYILSDVENVILESKSGMERIKEIVNGLKRFSRIDDGIAKRVQINTEIKNTLALVRNELKYRCTVALELGEVPEIECCPGEIGQVFMNLFVNASHAMKDEGGRITVKTMVEGDFLSIHVVDNGKGIPKENLDKIFNPFFTTKPVGQGTGLGLSISYGIITKHRGTIEVTSELGVGTDFHIRLPLSSPFT